MRNLLFTPVDKRLCFTAIQWWRAGSMSPAPRSVSTSRCDYSPILYKKKNDQCHEIHLKFWLKNMIMNVFKVAALQARTPPVVQVRKLMEQLPFGGSHESQVSSDYPLFISFYTQKARVSDDALTLLEACDMLPARHRCIAEKHIWFSGGTHFS